MTNRHGGSLHYVRPDRIVRTGVLQPIVGYQPQNDVMMVTSEFTSGPSSGMQLAGFGAPIGQGPIATWFKMLGARIKQTLNASRANQMMLTNASHASAQAVAHASEQSAVMAVTGMNPNVQVNAPQQHAMAQMANFLTFRDAPARGALFFQRRWNTYYDAG